MKRLHGEVLEAGSTQAEERGWPPPPPSPRDILTLLLLTGAMQLICSCFSPRDCLVQLSAFIYF